MGEEFEFLTGEDARLLLEDAESRWFAPGEVILAAGSTRLALFFLRTGSARMGAERLTAPVLFGERSFIGETEAAAKVVAEEPCDVQLIEGAHVVGLIESVPGFGARFYRTLAMQLAQRLREKTAVAPSLLVEQVSQARRLSA